MSAAAQLIENAFERLEARPGFVARNDQIQLALLLSDLMEGGDRGVFEAPTGLGKSLAALVPALAHAVESGRRTVISTYTNVLAEQYWRSDLPLALSLFDEQESRIKTQLLMGRQRYACMEAATEVDPGLAMKLRSSCELGIESEVRGALGRPAKEMSGLWAKIAAPPVCPARLCPHYDECFYYNARKAAERAHIVITNHSVVIQDAIMARDLEDSDGLLGKFDFLILDEAHDLPSAAANGLEFELSMPKLASLLAVAGRIESIVNSLAHRMGEGFAWAKSCADFRLAVERCQKGLIAYSLSQGSTGILTASPPELMQHPQVKASLTRDDMQGAKDLASELSEACEAFVKGLHGKLEAWMTVAPDAAKVVSDTVRMYGLYLREYGIGCYKLFDPQGVSVSYVGRSGQDAILRQDVIDLAEPLRELLWERTPYACLSATLALDGSFDFFLRTTGAEPSFLEALPSPFDFGSQAALYLPPTGAIPDPTVARREGREPEYWQLVAKELSAIIRAAGGRTLALFHSRKEMEGVLQFMDLPPELPIYMQGRYGASTVGDRFRKKMNASLFALRSYWTGFDAPGPTLSVVALVRIPFEVPVEPPQIARLAHLQNAGLNAFASHTLPLAKMLIRQGAGRLIRRSDDRGLICVLDPRIQTKRYGEEILANLPPEMRSFRDFGDALGFIGLEEASELVV